MHCRFTVAFSAAVGSPLQKKTKTILFFKCETSCGRLSRADNSAILSSAGSPIGPEALFICPAQEAGAAAKAKASKAEQDKKEEAAKAQKDKDEADPKKKKRNAKRPREGDADDDDDDEDDTIDAIVWTEKNTGLSADLMKFFPLKFEYARWQALLSSIKGRSAVDLRLDALHRKIEEAAKKTKTDDDKVARSSIRLLMYKAAPDEASELAAIAGLLASIDVVEALKPPPSILKSAQCVGEDGTVEIGSVLSDGAVIHFVTVGRGWLRQLFLDLVEEVKGEVTQYVVKDGGKRSLVPSAERFAFILMNGHAKFVVKLPPNRKQPPLPDILATRWSIPCRDNVQPWHALPLFVQAGIIVQASKANPEDLPIMQAVTALDTYIRHCFTAWREKFVNCTANKDAAKLLSTATTTAAATAAAAAAAAAVRTDHRITGSPAFQPRGRGGTPLLSMAGNLRPSAGAIPPTPPPPYTPPVFHTPIRGNGAAPSPALFTGLPGTQQRYTSCQAAGCPKGPKFGSSAHPYCGDHAPPEQRALQEYNREQHARREASFQSSSQQGGFQQGAPFKPNPSFNQFGPPHQANTMMAPMRR